MTLARNGDFMYVPTNLRVELYRAKTSLLSDYTPDLTKPANQEWLDNILYASGSSPSFDLIEFERKSFLEKMLTT